MPREGMDIASIKGPLETRRLMTHKMEGFILTSEPKILILLQLAAFL